MNRHRLFALLIILFAGLGGILYGYDIGIIAGALLFIKQEVTLSIAQISILAGTVLGGGSIAILIAGPLADRYGRRTMIVWAAITFILGILLLVSSHSFYGILVGRLVEGVGVGIVTIIIPLYLAEAAPSAVRGSSVTAFQLFLTSGILLAYLVSVILAHTHNWREMFLWSLVPALLLIIGAFILIESPRWLFVKGQGERALRALKRTRSVTEAEFDFKMMESLHEVGESTKQFFKKIRVRHNLLPLVIAFAIAILTQLTGINVFLQLCTLILKHAGLHSNLTSMLGSVGIGVANFVVTALAVLMVDKFGRKPLVSIGTAGIALALLYLGGIAKFLMPGSLQGYLMIVGFVAFIIFFAMGPGIVVWLAISELLPTSIRGKGMAICLFANSLASAVFASVFMDLTTVIGYSGVFWTCALFSILYFLTVVLFLPETKGKSLEEIEQHFRGK